MAVTVIVVLMAVVMVFMAVVIVIVIIVVTIIIVVTAVAMANRYARRKIRVMGIRVWLYFFTHPIAIIAYKTN